MLLDDGDHAYLYGPSLTPVAQVDGAGTVQYLHGDLLGSVRTGAVVGSSTFDAFGSRTAYTGTGDSLFGFTGNWTNLDTHLVHLRARDYDLATGQFLTVTRPWTPRGSRMRTRATASHPASTPPTPGLH